MKIRIWGTREQCEDLVSEILTILQIDGYDVKSCTGWYENDRHSLYPKKDPRNEGRVYIDFE